MKIEVKDGNTRLYTVDFWYTEYGKALHIEAESKEQAEQWLYDEMEQNGLDDIEHKINGREYGAQDAEEIIE